MISFCLSLSQEENYRMGDFDECDRRPCTLNIVYSWIEECAVHAVLAWIELAYKLRGRDGQFLTKYKIGFVFELEKEREHKFHVD